ncbi:uncharacterized protein BXZ73DRAFT_101843 [Epithele typhae]|uniref:uncharacterized protein n=1 Tax=Epithele typhae TaxID=378194 RepID=UPI0020073F93|nr:uncharacterized protein BXZ73DRAFT_101843 [Epithele typhae]KAH9930470.1 hypothetical protein BXZ73DRAFT_101843 [Epithele typhae]
MSLGEELEQIEMSATTSSSSHLISILTGYSSGPTPPHILRSHIAFITTFFDLARPAKVPGVKPYDKKTYDKKAGVWHSTSFILATGNETTGRVEAKVIALTGRRTRHEISALLSRDVSQRADASRTFPGPFEGCVDDGYEVMYDVLFGIQKFRCHVRDVVNVTQFFIGCTPAPFHRTLLLAFIAHRCCVKLAFRIENGRNMWDLLDDNDERQHPIAFIHNEMMKATDTLFIPTDTFIPIPRVLQSDLEGGGLYKDPSRPAAPGYDSYLVTRENAASWAQLLWKSVNTMETVLKAVKEKTVTIKYSWISSVQCSVKKKLDDTRNVRCSQLEPSSVEEQETSECRSDI